MLNEVALGWRHIIPAGIEVLYNLISGREPLDSEQLMLNFYANGQRSDARK